MAGGKEDLVVCDCTFKPEDHWVSIGNGRKQRRKYPRRSQLSYPSPSSLNQPAASSGLLDDGLDRYEHEGDNGFMLDHGFDDSQWPTEEERLERGLGIYIIRRMWLAMILKPMTSMGIILILLSNPAWKVI